MATRTELQALVEDIIQDSSFTVTDYLNRGVNEIAGGMLSTVGAVITPPLPQLFKTATVDTVTDEAFVSMPATFHRSLQLVSNSDGREIDLYNSMIRFVANYPLLNGTGAVEATIEQGGNLYYQKIPTVAETLTVHYFRLPVRMTEDSHTPDGIPSHLQIPLLVNYASWQAWRLIEDGIKGEGPNTARYKQFFNEALKVLELSIPTDVRSLFLGD